MTPFLFVFFLGFQNSSDLELHKLITAPVETVGVRWNVTEVRASTKTIPTKDKPMTVEEKTEVQYIQEALQVKDTHELLGVLRTYSRATVAGKGKTTPLPFQGKNLIAEKDPSHRWTAACFVLENGNRKDVPVLEPLLEKELKGIDATRYAYRAFLKDVPQKTLALGASWPIGPDLLAEDLPTTGFDTVTPKLTMTLDKVTDKACHFTLRGTLLLAKKPSATEGITWEGEIVAHITIAKGPYRELERQVTINDKVTMTFKGKTASGTGKQSLLRTIQPAPTP